MVFDSNSEGRSSHSSREAASIASHYTSQSIHPGPSTSVSQKSAASHSAPASSSAHVPPSRPEKANNPSSSIASAVEGDASKPYSSPFKRPTTPPSKPRSQRHSMTSSNPDSDSPVKGRLSSASEYRSGFADAQRNAILQDLGQTVPRGSLEYFQSIMPPLRHEFDVDLIVESLIDSGDLVESRGGLYVWREFRHIKKAREDTMYNQPLKNIFEAIIDAAKKTSSTSAKPTVCLINDGNKIPWSMRQGSTRPDGYLVLEDSEESMEDKLLWYNIAVAFEFKTSTGPEHIFKNIQQTIHSMQHILAVDPCRRHTYGINIEGTALRIWSASRAMLIACETFDLRTQYKELIRLFLSMAFASKEELGWDMTTKAKFENGNRLYDIEISGEHYYTSENEMISGDKADGLVSSGTRVWRARKGSREHGDEVVIKDYWHGEERDTEDAIYEMILEDISDTEKREYFRTHTLSPIASERVQACGTDDHTKDTILRGQSPDLSMPFQFPVPPSHGSFKSTVTSIPGMESAVNMQYRKFMDALKRNKRVKYYHRFHHRIVYGEVAIPYYKLRNTSDMYTVLIDVLKTLLYMHEAGWVHRDISVGNLYLYKDPVTKETRGLIGDFEYAKRVGWGGMHDIRTGTPNFMAIEVAKQGYSFRPMRQRNLRKHLELRRIRSNDSGNIQLPRSTQAEENSDDSKCDFYHNHLHDLESLWWIFVWSAFVYEKAPAMDDDESIELAAEQMQYYNLLFPSAISSEERVSFLAFEDTFFKYISYIPPSFHVQKEMIDIFRYVLVKAYQKSEEKITGPLHFSSPVVHEDIMGALIDVKFPDLEVVPVFNRQDMAGVKRKADEELLSEDPKKSRQD